MCIEVSIFSDEFLSSQLAFRGGTALHKLYLSPQPRYSEDIDLVQITPGPIKPIMYRLGEVLDWLPDRVTKVTPRDGGGTQNRQKSANMTAVKKRKCKHLQRRFSSSLYIHIR